MFKLIQLTCFIGIPFFLLTNSEWNSLQRENTRSKNLLICEETQVVLTNFSATRLGSQMVLLKWETQSEMDSKGFVIERSIDGGFYDSLAFVGGASEASRPMHYHYIDVISEKPDILYRLKHKGISEAVAYSDPIPIQQAEALQAISEISVSPQYFQDSVRVSFLSRKEGSFRFFLYSARGEMLHTQSVQTQAGPGQLHFVDTVGLPQGTYVASLENTAGELTIVELVKK